MADAPPAPPPTLQVYNSYSVDPHYAVGFVGVCGFVLLVAVLLNLPRLARPSAWQGWCIAEGLRGYQRLPIEEKPGRRASLGQPLRGHGTWAYVKARFMYEPRWVGMDIGQLTLVVGYFAALLFCILHDSPLLFIPNRPGFLALAQLPIVFLLASKNGLLPWLLGRGYEKLNFMHRWAGRGMLLSTILHGSLWVRQDWLFQRDQLHIPKTTLGVGCCAVLIFITVFSLKPVRRYAYQLFFLSHTAGYVTLFILINYHTPFAVPYIYPAIAFYALDMFARMTRWRIKDAVATAPDEQMTLIRVADCDRGWVGGQHVRLRLFHGGRVFESHPLTLATAPGDGTLLLGSRVRGDWGAALNRLARTEPDGVKLSAMIDGPYGGCTLDIARAGSVLVVAGGSGATFALGVVDSLLASKDLRTHRVELAWCMRSYGCINWFADTMRALAARASERGVDLHITCFVTCLCNPEALPNVPNMVVKIEKPSMRALLAPFVDVTEAVGDRVAVAVCGPHQLVREARNVVAGLSLTTMRRVGGVELHTELFSL